MGTRHRDDRDREIREEQRARVRDEMESWLAGRLVEFGGNESDDAIAEVVSAVEIFEEAAIAAGADTMVDSPDSSRPDRPELVLPRPHGDETAAAYADRIRVLARRIAANRNSL